MNGITVHSTWHTVNAIIFWFCLPATQSVGKEVFSSLEASCMMLILIGKVDQNTQASGGFVCQLPSLCELGGPGSSPPCPVAQIVHCTTPQILG